MKEAPFTTKIKLEVEVKHHGTSSPEDMVLHVMRYLLQVPMTEAVAINQARSDWLLHSEEPGKVVELPYCSMLNMRKTRKEFLGE